MLLDSNILIYGAHGDYPGLDTILGRSDLAAASVTRNEDDFRHINGLLCDYAGLTPWLFKPGGGTWDHTQDLGNIFRGLQNGVDQLQCATDPAQVAIRQQAEQAIQQIQQAIKGAGL